MSIRRLFCTLVPAAALYACSGDPAALLEGDGGPNGVDPSREDGAAIGDSGQPQPDDAGTSFDDSGLPPRDGEADTGTLSDGTLFGFVGSGDGKVRVYTVDANTGTWTAKKTTTVGTSPLFLAFDAPRRRVVAVDTTTAGMVRSLAFDPETGQLTERNAKPSGGSRPAHVSLTSNGDRVFVANYEGGNMSTFPLGANGLLGTATDTKASGTKSHWAGSDPTGKYVFVPALGIDVIAQYTLDGGTGKLANNGTAPLPAGAGPRHLAFHPNGKWAYVVNELGISVTTFDFDSVTGKLQSKQTVSELPPGVSPEGVTGAEIFVHPSGKYVYASTRVYNTIVHFTVNATNGMLTRVSNVPTGNNRPRSFGLDPSGKLLFAANQDAGEIVGFRVNEATGALTSLGKTVDVPSPAYVGLVNMK